MTQSLPLLLRPGARYVCHGDGLCCTDIHGVGPLSTKEKVHLSLLGEGFVRHDPALEADVIATAVDGRCVFLDPELRCMIYGAMDGLLKPRSCHRFPLGLTATPQGGRVTMLYRCPCQTHVADAPPLTVETAEQMLEGEEGLEASHTVETVPIDDDERIPFADYLPMEAAFLAEIEADGRDALELELPALEEVTWEALGRGMATGPVASRFDAALRFFGDAILSLRGEESGIEGLRPWAESFARAATRRPPEPDALLRDWIMEAVWSLHWTEHATWNQLRRGLGARIVIADQIAEKIGGATAWGEAVMIVDLIASSTWWEAANARILL